MNIVNLVTMNTEVCYVSFIHSGTNNMGPSGVYKLVCTFACYK